MYKKFESEDEIWSGGNAKHQAAPRAEFSFNQDISESRAYCFARQLDNLSAKGNLAITTSTDDYFQLVAIGGAPLRVIATVLRSKDNVGREIAVALLEDSAYQSVLNKFGVNKIVVENCPNPDRNGIYQPQVPWAKLQPAIA